MPIRKLAATAVLLSASLSTATPAHAGSEPYIAEIIAFPYNYCPRGYLSAQGQILSISQFTALFSLLGTTYGGNGQTTFALPDLRGRVALGTGTNPQGSYEWGELAGQERFTITVNQMPSHTHVGALRAVSSAGNTNDPTDNSMARAPAGVNMYSTVDPANNMNAGDVVLGTAGSSTPVTLTSPALALNYCIATQGIYPSRN